MTLRKFSIIVMYLLDNAQRNNNVTDRIDLQILKEWTKTLKKYKNLFNNSLLFAIGNLGSKFIVFIMLPLYTSRMLPSAFGMVDVITTTAALLLPVVSLSVFDAVLRFSMEKETDYTTLYSNSIRITQIGTIICLILTPIIYLISPQFSVLPLLLILESYQSLYIQFAKGIGRVALFAINGILLSFITAILNIIFLWPLNMGFTGYFISTCLAFLLSDLMLHHVMNLSSYFDKKTISSTEMRKLLTFSTPLIPNAVAWNISNSIGRYAILIVLGSTANGLFAVASKIPALLTTFTTIFAQSWELSAIEEFENKQTSNDHFFDNIYQGYINLLFTGTSALMLIIKPLIRVISAPEYFASWSYIPLLLLGVVFSSLSNFLASQYIASKKTNAILKTTILGTVISTVLTFAFISFMGANAVSAASLIGFVVTWIIRHNDIKTEIHTSINTFGVLFQGLLILAQYSCMFLPNQAVSLIGQGILFGLILFLNRDVISIILRKIRS